MSRFEEQWKTEVFIFGYMVKFEMDFVIQVEMVQRQLDIKIRVQGEVWVRKHKFEIRRCVYDDNQGEARWTTEGPIR